MLTNRPKAKQRWLDLAPGDTVLVTAGKDRGKQGEVLRTLPESGKIVVRGVNILKRHVKAGQSKGGTRAIQGGIVDYEAPFSYSNVMLVCPSCNKPTRVKHGEHGGRKVLVCRNCGEPYERVKKVEAQ
ncbi:MAG: 50S ribosomal protein L24 [Chloroflexi bacterium]|nr:MAG: 50S ribosomal protein L24 [Chloroflexota bacterium]TME15817.1 MAG: 50S ribosomal protein L24 [Chloroflexota bacterium]TME18058.1 MAG: 50S ribosomal protein L24 [Chloroflexota bacterium]